MSGEARLACRGAGAALAFAGGRARRPCRHSPQVKAAHRPSDVTLLDRHGVAVQTLRVDSSVRRLAWLPIDDMSPALLCAIVLSEDRRFWEHSGVDWAAAAKSAWANLFNTRTRGASTLTMQLAGLIDDGLARPAGGRSVVQKLGQAVTAARLEASWKKSEILEAYLNSVPFRGEIVGIDALGADAFRQARRRPRRARSGHRAALVRSPNARPATVAERACGVLRLQQLDCAGVARPCRGGAGAARRRCRWASSSRRTSRAWRSTRSARRRKKARSMRRCSASRVTTLRRQLAELARPQRRGRRRRRSRQRLRRSARLGRLERRAVRRGAGRRRAGAAPARLDAEALRLRARLREAPDHAGDADRRFAGADRDGRRPLSAAGLRPRLEGLRQRPHRARRQSQRAGGSGRDAARPRCALPAPAGARLRPARKAPAGTAPRSPSAAAT